MYHDIIRSILNSDLQEGEKLAKIREIVEKVDTIERLALQYASREDRKPTWDDRLYAIEEIEKSKDIQPVMIDRDGLADLLSSGIAWLKRTINENGGWKTKSDFQPYIVTEKPDKPFRPLDMLYVAPWEISLTVMTFADWVKYFSPDDDEALALIEQGKAYLREVQRFFRNGGLGESMWLKGIKPVKSNSTTNTLETAIAILAWDQLGERSPSNYSDAIEEAVGYLKNNWNKKEKGWGFRRGWKSDVKCTALALMTLTGQPSSRIDEELRRMLDGAMQWILDHQDREDGSWAYDISSRDSAVFGSFHAIEALTMKKYLLNLQKKQESEYLKKYQEIDLALSRALRWYESSQKFMKNGDIEGWGWGRQTEYSDVENTAAGVIILLDAGWLSETSPLIENTLYWLFRQKDPDQFWSVNTPIVLKAFVRFLKPEARLTDLLKQMTHSR